MGYLPLIIGYLIIVITPAVGLWSKFLPRLEQNRTSAYIPFYNYFVGLKASKQPWYWIIFLLMPGIQFIMWAVINVSIIRRFGIYGVKETILAILFPFPVFWKIANNEEDFPVVPMTNWNIEKQVNNRKASDHVALFFALPVVGNLLALFIERLGFKRKDGKKSVVKEWGDAILFAIIAASAIRTYVFEPYTIPTGSMEKTLMVGDYLFVEKITFGPRVPMTPFSYPIVHNSFSPLADVKSYVEIQKIPYTRLPGFRFVERNDVTVFNFPAGEKALNDARMPNGLIGHTYYQILMDEAFFMALREGKNAAQFEQNKQYYIDKALKNFENGKVYSKAPYEEDARRGYTEIKGVLDRPVDKRENYIKRCVAIAGDVIEIKNKELYVNGELGFQPKEMQYEFYIEGVSGFTTSERAAMEKSFNVQFLDINPNNNVNGNIVFPLNKENTAAAKAVYGDKLKPVIKERGFYNSYIEKGLISSYYPIFPNDPKYDWTEDNFGPLKIPASGDVVSLTAQTIPLYRRIITVHEGHQLEEKADGIYIDGVKSDTYTIEMNYYWLMGDNRNRSADSRFWGFVPEDHIVGRAAFIWMSRAADGSGTRWERMFTGIK